MLKCNKECCVKVATVVTFLVMITANVLANALPINGISTGEISDSYPNLFAPAGITFSIWGLIYLLLALHTLFQIGIIKDKKAKIKNDVMHKIAIAFSATSLINAAWIFAWHYLFFPLSLLLMVCLLLCLFYIVDLIKLKNLSNFEKLFVRLPFSIYFGWITVATIANVTIMLVSIEWGGFGLSETFWTVLMLLTATLIGGATVIRLKDIAFGGVLVWAFIGILLKHTFDDGFAGQYIGVIATVIICIIVLVGLLVYTKRKAMQKRATR